MDQPILPVSPEEITGIVSFLGYGNPCAKVWFIGLEEGLGKSNDQEACSNLRPRSKFGSVMDLYEAHLRLREKGKPINIETKSGFVQEWHFMAKIMLACNGLDWNDPNAAKEYIRRKLGRNGGDTFLTELSPIPTARNNDKSWINKFKAVDSTLGQKIEDRKSQLKQLLKASNSHLIICYGRKRANDFADLLDVEWQPVTSKISASRDSRFVLLPFFGQGQMSRSEIETLMQKGLLNY